MTDGIGGCRVEAVVTVDERGQMVLPKDLRERAQIRPGDKLAVASCMKGDEICCPVLMRADDLEDAVRGLIGPAMRGGE